MRTETIIRTIYTFDELSEQAKETARQWIRKTNAEIGFFWYDEALESIKKGLDAFNCSLDNYRIQWDNANLSTIKIGYPKNAEELNGIRLRTWLINNADPGTLTTAEHYGKYFFPEGSKRGRYPRYSRILKVASCCPFTGVCYDESFLDPIRKFIKEPTPGTTLSDLMEEATHAVLIDVQNEIEYQDTDEAIDEMIQDNEYEFTKNGQPA